MKTNAYVCRRNTRKIMHNSSSCGEYRNNLNRPDGFADGLLVGKNVLG